MDALIQVPGEEEGGPGPMGRGTRGVAVALLVLSALAIVATIAVDLAFPAPIKNPIGQEARDLSKAKRSRNPWDGSAANWIETQLKTRSRVRRSLAPFWSAFLMDTLDTVPRDLVAGKDGWLFLRDRVQPPKEFRARSIHLTGLVAAAMERRLARLGSKLIVLPIVRKSVACADRLPGGMDSDVAFDAAILEAIESRGVAALDVMAILGELPIEQRYFRRDSHWTFDGAKALAQAIAKAYPELATQATNIEVREKSVPASAHLLTFAAIDRDHPAADWINQDVVSRDVLKSSQLAKMMKTRPTNVDVAVVGSSFTRNYYFAELVAAALGQLVYPGGIAATPFGGSLAYFAGGFQDAEFPGHVLYEFPIHQVTHLGKGADSVQRSLTAFFVGSSQAGTVGLPTELLAPVSITKQKDRGVTAVFPPGTLLSTGDGVLQLRIKTKTAKPSDWRLRSSDMGQTWKLGKGEHDQLMPILQTHPNGFAVQLTGVGAPGNNPEVQIEVVVDADLGRSVEIPLAANGDSGLRGAPRDASVGSHDVVTVQWGGSPELVGVVIRGTTPDGDEREVVCEFEKPLSKICVLSLTPLEGGQVQSIEVRGASDGVQAFVAPQLQD